MLRFEKTLASPEISHPELSSRADELLFFDIETTGLSRYKSALYLIGMVLKDPSDDSWKLIQLFSESPADELDVLRSFIHYLSEKRILVSFNGDGFDIPFIKGICSQYGLDDPFLDIESFDIYKKLRSVKKILSLESQRLKACERFIGIDREDPYDGGQLIQVYAEWQHTKAPALLDMLLLHNGEDLENLPAVAAILNYGMLEPENVRLSARETVSYDGRYYLDLHYTSDISFPASVDYRKDDLFFSFSDTAVHLTVPIINTELKMFFSDYRSYYYLPAEDTAIHCAVGEFVDPKCRVRAKADTCYQRVSGQFIPQKGQIFTPVFQHTRRSPYKFARLDDTLFDAPDSAAAYLCQMLYN